MGLYLGLPQDNYPGRRPQAPACFKYQKTKQHFLHSITIPRLFRSESTHSTSFSNSSILWRSATTNFSLSSSFPWLSSSFPWPKRLCVRSGWGNWNQFEWAFFGQMNRTCRACTLQYIMVCLSINKLQLDTSNTTWTNQHGTLWKEGSDCANHSEIIHL